MNLYVLLVVFITAIIGMTYIVILKFPYLRRLSPEILEGLKVHKGFFEELFPEIYDIVNKSILYSFRKIVLELFADIARVARRLWHITGHWVHNINDILQAKHARIRKEEHKKQRKHTLILTYDNIRKAEKSFKEKEQELIVEIARNPKDPVGYNRLGDLYVEYVQWADARQSYEKAVELGMKDDAIKLKLDKVLKNSTI